MNRSTSLCISSLAALFVLGGSGAIAQNVAPRIQWANHFGGSSGEEPYCITPTNDGGSIVAGETNSNDHDVVGNHGGEDCWIVKLDALGKIQWARAYGSTEGDEARCIQQTFDGGYVFAGYASKNDGNVSVNHGNADCWIVKLDTLGNITWEKSFGGKNADIAYSIRQTRDSGFIFAGETQSDDGDIHSRRFTSTQFSDYWIVKLDKVGNLVWEKTLGGESDDVAFSIQQTSDDKYIIAGSTRSTNIDVAGNHGGEGEDMWVVKIDEGGSIIWAHCFGGTESDWAQDVRQTRDGGYVVAGVTNSYDGDVTGNHPGKGQDFWIVKLDSAGNLVWEKALGGTAQEIACSVEESGDGGFIAAGYSNSNDGDVTGNHGDDDVWIVKLDALSNLVWEKSIGGTNGDYCWANAAIVSDGIIVAAMSTSSDGDVSGNYGGRDFWIVKLNGGPQISCRQNNAFPALICEQQAFDTLWVHNVGSQPLVIDSAVFSAFGNIEFFLTVVTFPVVIVPQDSSPFFLSFLPTINSNWGSTLNLYSNDSGHSPWPVFLAGRKDSLGYSVSGIRNDTIDFGYIGCKGSIDTTFTLTCTSSEIIPTLISLNNSNPSFTTLPLITLDSGAVDSINVAFLGSVAGTEFVDTLTITDNCGQTTRVIVMVSKDEPQVAVSTIADTTLCPGDSVVRFAIVKNLSHTTQTLALSGGAPLFTATPGNLEVSAGDSATLQIVFHGSPAVGAYSASYEFDDGCGGVHPFAENVFVDSSHVTVPVSIDTTVCPQTPIAVMLPIENNGAMSRTISLTSDAWSVSRPSVTLDAGQQDSVMVMFPGGAIGAHATTVHVTDDCGGNHDVKVTVYVQNHFPVQLSLREDPQATTIGTERKVTILGNRLSKITGGITFTLTNESTTLLFDSISSTCATSVVRGADSNVITFTTCPPPTTDTLATVYYRTLVGSTLSPAVILQNAFSSSPCEEAYGTATVNINLLPPGCELGTVVVHSNVASIQSIFPNPATGVTTITYATIEHATVNLNMYDALGRMVMPLVNTLQQPGVYTAAFDTEALTSGLFYLGMRVGRFSATREMLVVR